MERGCSATGSLADDDLPQSPELSSSPEASANRTTSNDAADLLIDLGNTNASAAILADGACLVVDRPPSVGARATDLQALVDAAVQRARPTRVFAASVASDERVAALDAALEGAGLPRARVNPPSGLHLALDRPETCGFDRQFAARAALERGAEASIVVDVGTALTVDAVVPVDHPAAQRLADRGGALPSDCAGVFLGGSIAPGPGLLAGALERGGARLWQVELSPDAPALGRSSEEAMRAGVVVGLEGAALHLARRIADEVGFPSGTPVWLTGGAAAFVQRAFTAGFGSELRLAPALVLEGLAAAVRDVGGQP